MRVGIEATSLLIAQKTGIEHYSESLICALVDLLREEADLELYLYLYKGNRYVDAALVEGLAARVAPGKLRAWPFRRGYRWGLPLMAAADRLDLLHLPAPEELRFSPCPLLVTVHDLCWASLPPELVPAERAFIQPTFENMLGKRPAFLAVSQSTRNDLVKFYRIPEEKIWVTYEGPKSPTQPEAVKIQDVIGKYGLEKFILYVGTLQQRKNLVRLVQAFALLAGLGCTDHQLVLAGTKGPGYEEVRAEIESQGLSEKVRILGYVPNGDLAGLYAAADVFVYPSLYEGFGLPVLEAMALGVPVAASNTSSLPEVGGEAALYFNPLEPVEMAETIASILNSPALREDLRCKGMAQAQRFTWNETARQTMQVYQALAA